MASAGVFYATGRESPTSELCVMVEFVDAAMVTLVFVRILIFKSSLLVTTKPSNMKYMISWVCTTMLLMNI